MPKYDGTLKFDTKIDVTGFNRGIKSIKSQATKLSSEYKKGSTSIVQSTGQIGNAFKSLLSSLGAVALLVKALQWLFRTAKEAIGIASDLQEVQNIVDTVFGNSAGVINSFAKSALKDFGLSELAVKQYAGAFGAMGQAMGMSAQQNLDMSTTLTGLIGDLSSFYNKEQDLVQVALQSIYTGETQNNTLREMGILLTENTLQQYALSQGITRSVSSMSEAEKVNLRYNYVLQATNIAQGDFIKTQDSWANQTRILSQTWKELLGLLGSGLISALTPAIQILNQLLSVLVSATQSFLAFWSALTGRDIQQTQSLGEAASGAAGSYDDMAGAAGGAAQEQEKLNDELNNTLAAFDEINVLEKDTITSPTTSSGSGGGGSDSGAAGGGVAGEVATIFGEESTPTPEISPFWQKMLDLLEPFKKIDFTNLKTSLNNLYGALKPFGVTLFEGLELFVDKILTPLTTWTIEDFLPVYFNNLAARIAFLDSVLQIFKGLAEWFIDEYLTEMSKPIGDGIIDLLEVDTAGWQTLADFLANNKDKIIEIITTLVENAPSLLNFIDNLAEAYEKFANGETPSLLEILLGEDNAKTIQGFKKSWEEFKKYFNTKVLPDIHSLFLSLDPVMVDALIAVGDALFPYLVAPFNSLVCVAEFAINGIINSINMMIDAINALSITIPDWVPNIGGNTYNPSFTNIPEISIPRVPTKIPRLATGAVIPPNSEFLAILGDQKSGTNIEAPLDTIVQAVTAALDTREYNSGDSTIEYNGLGDMTELARQLLEPLQYELKRRGINLRVNA